MNLDRAQTPIIWRFLNLTLLVLQLLSLPLHLALALQDKQFWQESVEAFRAQQGSELYYAIVLDWPIALFAALLLGFSVAKEFLHFSVSQKLKINIGLFIVMWAIPLTVMYQLRPGV
ncbi:hypothetical protein [Halospina sp. K52047b]|uniref:hypothetical protein n=1 Tax=Halospina sp. K52047b TaxID=2614160 RepID=UPI00124AAA82|nr:hypothetical protein [Halospina sp. K52047b]KAA8977831.1 hypothetical protein F3089_14735 [Halospina sp. K52047b]